MPEALQAVLFTAGVAVTVLVACLIPMLFQARRRLGQVAATAEHFKAALIPLVDESRDLVRTLTHLGERANRDLDGLTCVVRTVEQWAERADHLVNELGSAIEPPVHSAARTISLARAGMHGFLDVLLHRNNSN
jgi:hypothetical protein